MKILQTKPIDHCLFYCNTLSIPDMHRQLRRANYIPFQPNISLIPLHKKNDNNVEQRGILKL